MNNKNTILAIDTASEYLSLGIKNETITDSILLKVDNKQSTFILPQINELLNQHNLSIQQLSCIAYNQGPGSFTGLRIGISIAMGLSYGLDIKLIAIPSFAIYANTCKTELTKLNTNKILVGIDARLGQVYLAGINLNDFSYFMEPNLANPNEIKSVDNCILCGNAFEIYQDKLTSEVKKMIHIPNKSIYPSALNLIELCDYYQHKSPQEADLLYVRNKIALNLEEQHASKSSKST